MNKWKILIPVVVIGLIVAWYEFRPERIVVNKSVDEAMPVFAGGAAPQPVETGTFHSVFHPTEGTATIYREGDGSRLLRLTSFKTSNGPDVHIYLVAAPDAIDSPSVLHAGYIDLGLMKGNIGDQNYALGPDVDLAKYQSVSVWCKRFSYNFGTAPLTSEHLVTQQ